MRIPVITASIALVSGLTSWSDVSKSPSAQPQARLSRSSSVCEEGDPLRWFGPIHELPSGGCADGVVVFANVGSAATGDIDGDGVGDNLLPGGLLRSNNEDVRGQAALTRVSLHMAENPPKTTGQRLASTEHINDWLNENSERRSPYEGIAGCGIADLDDDGDLDVVLRIQGYDLSGPPGGYDRFIWLENIAASAPRVGDLNHDGAVDGADLGVLLGEWSPAN